MEPRIPRTADSNWHHFSFSSRYLTNCEQLCSKHTICKFKIHLLAIRRTSIMRRGGTLPFPIWLSCSVLCKNFGSFQFHRMDCCSPKPTPLLAFFEYLLLLIRKNSKGSKSIAPSFSNLLLHKDHSIVSTHSLWRLQKQNLQQPVHYREYRNYQVKFLFLFCFAKDCIL